MQEGAGFVFPELLLKVLEETVRLRLHLGVSSNRKMAPFGFL